MEISHQLRLDREHDEASFERRRRMVVSLGRLAVSLVEARYGSDTAERYDDENWEYDDLLNYAEDNGLSVEQAAQVFRHWYDITTQELDLVPVNADFARKHMSYPLSLLGAALEGGQIRGPRSRALLRDFHDMALHSLKD